MAVKIHDRAIVSPDAMLGDDVEIGPYAIIEADVTIGAGTRVGAYTQICAGTTIGTGNEIHMSVVLGNVPQDMSYSGAPTRLRIGDRNVIREGCHVHRGTAPDSETVIGDDGFFMCGSHIAHNCVVGNGVLLASGALLGGHAQVGDNAFLSGNAVVHQHGRIGRLSLVQGGSAMSRDVPPFLLASGLNVVRGVNVVGLRRAGLGRDAIGAIRRMFRTLFFRRPNLSRAREKLLQTEEGRGGVTPEVQEVLDFIEKSERGVCTGAGARRDSEAS